MQLSTFEFSTALKLSALGYAAKAQGDTFAEYKLRVLSEIKTTLRLGANDRPFVAYDDEKIRVIVVTIASVAYVSITGTNSSEDMLANSAVCAQRIVSDAYAPAGYLKGARALGIVRLARALLDCNQLQKVILCGHSRGGSVAHTAHYELISDARYSFDKTKLLSVAFGSTPFLKSHRPNVDEASLFVGPVILLVRDALLREHRVKTALGNLLCYFLGTDVPTLSGQVLNDRIESLSEYEYYGEWINLSVCRGSPWTLDADPTVLFRSESFLVARNGAQIVRQHGIKDTYAAFVVQGATAPSANDEDLQDKVYMTAATTLVVSDTSSASLAVLLNKIMVAAVVTMTLGNTEISDDLGQFVRALDEYLTVVYTLANENDATIDDVEAKVADDMQGWTGFAARLAAIQDHSADEAGSWNTLNDDNITANMNSLAIFTASVLSASHLAEPPSLWANIKETVLSGVSEVSGDLFPLIALTAIALFGAMAAPLWVHALFLLFGATIPAGSAELCAMPPAMTHPSTQLASTRSPYLALTDVRQNVDVAAPDAAIRMRSEAYKETESAYVHHLKAIAAATNVAIGDDDKNEQAIEEKLIETTNLRPTDPANQRLVDKFIAVLRTIRDLRAVCQNVVFIVINGNQNVGKSWFLRALNNQPAPPRSTTDFPEFRPYVPHGAENTDPRRRVYILDLPGNNSDSDHRRRFVKELYGISRIGIHLFACDTEPCISDEDLQSMWQMFSRCDDVLICLNKALLMGIEWQEPEDATNEDDRPLAPIRAKWQQHFEANGVEFDGANTKYHLKITDMHGTHKPRPQHKMDKYDQDVKEELDKFRDNGGESTREVLAWIDAAIAKVVPAPRQRRRIDARGRGLDCRYGRQGRSRPRAVDDRPDVTS